MIANIIKETSSNVALAFEGTYIGGNNASGTFNMVRNNNTFSGVSKGHNDGGRAFTFSGTINADGGFTSSFTVNNYLSDLDVDFTISGEFDGNQVSGTWSNGGYGSTNSGTFSGQKTL